MPRFQGLDIGALRSVALDAADAAQELERTAARLDALAGHLQGAWQGREPERFVDAWSSEHRLALAAASAALATFAAAARHAAEEQESASSAI